MYKPLANGVVDAQFLDYNHLVPCEEMSVEMGAELLSRHCVERHHLWHNEEWHTDPRLLTSGHIHRVADRQVDVDEFFFVPHHGGDEDIVPPDNDDGVVNLATNGIYDKALPPAAACKTSPYIDAEDFVVPVGPSPASPTAFSTN